MGDRFKGMNIDLIVLVQIDEELAIAGRVLPYVLGMLTVVLLLAYLPVLSLWAL